MDVQLINEELLDALSQQAKASERLRQNFDLRTTPEDTSQRMLNYLEVGTVVPIHRHEDTSETVICLKGRLDWIFYEELPNMDAGGPVHDGKTAADPSQFKEFFRTEICPAKGKYGIQIPQGALHSIEVKEEACILEAKDGPYKG